MAQPSGRTPPAGVRRGSREDCMARKGLVRECLKLYKKQGNREQNLQNGGIYERENKSSCKQ